MTWIMFAFYHLKVDFSQSPIFPYDFRDSYASIELPPSLFVGASATWGECLNYRGGPSQVTLRSLLQTKMAAVHAIEANETRKSHGKIGDCEESILKVTKRLL